MSGYEELRIFSIVMRTRRTEKVDYSQITKYLHQAVFLKNNAAYVDEMVLPKLTLELSLTDLVRMYCYVLWEIKRQLEEDTALAPEIINQAQIFHELNLQPDSALFSLNHEFTIQLLRTTLNNIHQQVSLKDDDYWHFYLALENFLYGVPSPSNESGILWGITNFFDVWEDMCTFYMYHKDWEDVWYADNARFANTRIGGHKVFLDSNYKSPFYFKLNNKKRFLRPDLVRVIKPFDEHKWFDSNFKVEWFNNHTCRITLLDRKCLSWFDYGLDKKLKKRSPGMRQKKQGATSHVYNPINKQQVDRSIVETKNEAQAKFTRPPFHIIVDFKYVNAPSYSEEYLSDKIKFDIIKQLTYEYSIVLNSPGAINKVKSQFCVPYLFESNFSEIYQRVENSQLHDDLRSQGIEILKVNFREVQEVYISNQ